MHPGGVRSAMHLFNFEKSANLKHPNDHGYDQDSAQSPPDTHNLPNDGGGKGEN